MTNREQEIADRLAKAKATAWAVDQDDREDMEFNNHIVEEADANLTICFMAHGGQDRQDEFDAKAELIANAPSDLAYYRDLVAGLRAQIEEAKRLLDCDAPNLAREALEDKS